MAQIIKEITVDVAKKNLLQAIIAKQNDSNSRFLKVTLCNEGVKIKVPSTATAIINAERADGASAGYKGVVNDDGTVTVPLTKWMLSIDDVVRCSVSIIDSDEQKLSSTSFAIEVEAAEYSDSDVSEDENYDILVRLISDATNAAKEANEAVRNASDIANDMQKIMDCVPLPTAADIGKVLTATATNHAEWTAVANAEEVAV